MGKAPQRAVRCIKWGVDDEKREWMLENDNGRTVDELSGMFAERFGYPLSRPQITQFRQTYGNVSRQNLTHAVEKASRRPVGSLSMTKEGLKVKTALIPEKPGTKDNWKLLKVAAYEEWHGEIPYGCNVVQCNGNPYDISPDNLVAVPIQLMVQMNLRRSEWWDRESALVCMEALKLHGKVLELRNAERKCELCGRTFVPRLKTTQHAKTRTCPSCVDAGHKAIGSARSKCECRVCGKPFEGYRCNSNRCPDCVGQKPKHAWRAHRKYNEKRGIYVCPWNSEWGSE